MIIYHENLPAEAEHVAGVLKKVYQLPVEIESANLDGFYGEKELSNGTGPIFEWYDWLNSLKPRQVDGQPVAEQRMILSQKEQYVHFSETMEDWVNGYSLHDMRFSLVSVARLKGVDSKPTAELKVSQERYFDRIAYMSIHELGHELIRAPHFKKAFCCKTDSTGNVIHKLKLGSHCTDPSCTMYEIIDLKPEPNEFMLLGGEKRYDAYLDELLDRRYPDWLCSSCNVVAKKGDDRAPIKPVVQDRIEVIKVGHKKS
jgi:hypothetical protein